MSGARLKVEAYRVWTASQCNPAEYVSGGGVVDSTEERGASPGAALPAGYRRRMSRASRMALEVATGIPGVDAAGYMVFCSQHGEIARTVGILLGMADDLEPSPTDFAMSVHNTSAGMFSILSGSTKASTSIGAGEMSFIAGWLEAAAWLASNPGEKVLLVMFEELLPEPYHEFVERPHPAYAAALLLSSVERGIHLQPARHDCRGPSPTAPAFLAWLATDAPIMKCVVEGRPWQWVRDA